MSRVTVTRDAIAHRSDMAERIGCALNGITTVLIKDMVSRESGDQVPLLDPMTLGNMHDALLALSDQLDHLAAYIEELGSAGHTEKASGSMPTKPDLCPGGGES